MAPFTSSLSLNPHQPLTPQPTPSPLRPHPHPSAHTRSQPLLDPVAEHRTWSPWLELTSGDHAPAWMRLVALLLPPPALPAAKGRPTASALSSVIAML